MGMLIHRHFVEAEAREARQAAEKVHESVSAPKNEEPVTQEEKPATKAVKPVKRGGRRVK